MRNDTRTIVLTAALAVTLAAAGCAPGVATGGGTIPSKNPAMKGVTKANFGFWGDSCYGTTTGNFNYHDKSAFNDGKNDGLKMEGPIRGACDCMQVGGSSTCDGLCAICESLAVLCDDVGGENAYVSAIKAHYYSTNPKKLGGGSVYACVVDNGEGGKADADDVLAVKVEDGPYGGYINWGRVRGNAQVYPCADD